MTHSVPSGGGLGRPLSFPVRVRGFTLPELILVLVLIGILSVVAIPRLFSTQDFAAYAFAADVTSAVRFAQSTAIARNEAVTLAFFASGFRVCAGETCSAGGDYLSSPGGGAWDGSAPGQGGAPSGVAVSAMPVNTLRFDGLGRADVALTVQIDGRSLNISEAGHVEGP